MIWPSELARPTHGDDWHWRDAGSNCALDFHGSPARARLTLFSDGNHHMALAETLRAFVSTYPDVDDVFYVTLPPPVLVELLQARRFFLGNLQLDLQPTAFVGPRGFMERVADHIPRLTLPRAFARSRGQALLIRRGNPKRILEPTDVFRDDVRLFISNPNRERASYDVYAETLIRQAAQAGLDADRVRAQLESGQDNIVHGEHVHHREAPAAIADGRADAAILYQHLALRYCRVFQDEFEMIEFHNHPDTAAIRTEYFVTAVEHDVWGERVAAFLFEHAARNAYTYHGLEHLTEATAV